MEMGNEVMRANVEMGSWRCGERRVRGVGPGKLLLLVRPACLGLGATRRCSHQSPRLLRVFGALQDELVMPMEDEQRRPRQHVPETWHDFAARLDRGRLKLGAVHVGPRCRRKPEDRVLKRSSVPRWSGADGSSFGSCRASTESQAKAVG